MLWVALALVNCLNIASPPNGQNLIPQRLLPGGVSQDYFFDPTTGESTETLILKFGPAFDGSTVTIKYIVRYIGERLRSRPGVVEKVITRERNSIEVTNSPRNVKVV